MRINIYKQIRGFYSRIFEGDIDIRSTHVSLYMFLLNQNNRVNWAEWFKIPHDTAIQGACIGSKNTFYKAIQELADMGFIEYKKGKNNYKAPKVKIVPLENGGENLPKPEEKSGQSEGFCFPKIEKALGKLSGKLTEKASEKLDGKLSEKLTANRDILVTGNYVINIQVSSKGEGTDKSENENEDFDWDSITTIGKERCKDLVKKHGYPQEFEELYQMSFRKGDKIAAFTHWLKLTRQQKEKVKEHWPEYTELKNDKYQKMFRTYLDDMGWEMDLEQFKDKEKTKTYGGMFGI